MEDRQEQLDTAGDGKQHWSRQPGKTPFLWGFRQSLSFAVPSSGQQGQAELQTVLRKSLVTSTTWASFSHLLRTFCMSWKTCCRTTTTCKEQEGLNAPALPSSWYMVHYPLIPLSWHQQFTAGLWPGCGKEHQATTLLTGLGPCCTGSFLTSVLSWSSSWWLMSRVVKRLESKPRMWMMASLLEGLGCQGK